MGISSMRTPEYENLQVWRNEISRIGKFQGHCQKFLTHKYGCLSCIFILSTSGTDWMCKMCGMCRISSHKEEVVH